MTQTAAPKLLFRLIRAADWQAAAAAGVFTGSDTDRADGFIHLSTADQVSGTAARWYPGLDDLMVLTVDRDALKSPVKMEASTKGTLYPHLYGPLPLEAVMAADAVPRDADGDYRFPDGLGVDGFI